MPSPDTLRVKIIEEHEARKQDTESVDTPGALMAKRKWKEGSTNQKSHKKTTEGREKVESNEKFT